MLLPSKRILLGYQFATKMVFVRCQFAIKIASVSVPVRQQNGLCVGSNSLPKRPLFGCQVCLPFTVNSGPKMATVWVPSQAPDYRFSRIKMRRNISIVTAQRMEILDAYDLSNVLASLNPENANENVKFLEISKISID